MTARGRDGHFKNMTIHLMTFNNQQWRRAVEKHLAVP